LLRGDVLSDLSAWQLNPLSAAISNSSRTADRTGERRFQILDCGLRNAIVPPHEGVKGLDVASSVVANAAKDCKGKFASGRTSELLTVTLCFEASLLVDTPISRLRRGLGGWGMLRVAVFLMMLFTASKAFSQTQMQFTVFPPDRPTNALAGAHAWRIYASGPIDEDADKRLEEVIQRNNIPYHSDILLHSYGGSLVGGMKLGKVMRKHLLRSNVGQLDLSSKDQGSPKAGNCYSACAMAYLGGEYRFLMTGSVYGIHRFYTDKQTKQDADLAQMMSALVVQYIRSMDVNTEIFTLASRAGRDEIVTPSPEMLVRLNVVNNGTKPAKWSIESVPHGIYLKGEQQTPNGTNKLMITCAPGEPVGLFVIFDAGMNAEDTTNFNAETLMIDSTKISLAGRRERIKSVNGKINLSYYIDATILDAISKARTVGVLLQPTTEAAVNLGFESMPFDEGRAKLPGFLQVCKH